MFNVCTVTILTHSSLIADFEREMAIPKEPTQLRDEEDATVEAEGMTSVVSCVKEMTRLTAISVVKGDNLGWLVVRLILWSD